MNKIIMDTKYEKIKVSIVVAIFNSADFLDKLIKSILNQTHKNIEIILVDDGSPDNSGDICDKYAAQDNRIIVIHKTNGGTCDARNKGMEKVTSDYMCIIDGDDWLEPDYIEYLLKMSVDSDADMALSDKVFTTRDRVQTKVDKIENWTSEEATAHIIYAHVPIGPWSKIYRTSFIRKNNLIFEEPWCGEGLYFTAMAAQLANHITVGHKKVYDYRLNNTGSGLTHYSVIMGQNALRNINKIEERLVIDTPKVRNAIYWHTWVNNGLLLKLIIATHTEKGNSEEYKKCLSNFRRMFPKALIKSDFSLTYKLKMSLIGLFPIIGFKWRIKRNERRLANDKMK